MTENLIPITKIEDLKKGTFNIRAKVTIANDGYPGSKYLQRGVLGDETGSIDFVIYRDAELDPINCEEVYEFTNILAWDNTGYLTVRPNKRKHGCIITKIDEDIDVNPDLIFEEKQCIPPLLVPEINRTCLMVFDRIFHETLSQNLSEYDRAILLAAVHEGLRDDYLKGKWVAYGETYYQDAYMFGYFSYYIGMIYHILQTITFENSAEIFKNDMKICLYGSGPAPELLGLVGYLRDFQPHVHRIKVVFFDLNNWDDWREYCLTQLLPIFWGGTVDPVFLPLNILNFSEEGNEEHIEEISSASIHIFQNVISDLYRTPENLQRLGPPFFNLYQKTSPGSIMILSDQYYGKTQRIFDQISVITMRHKIGTTLVRPTSVQFYQRTFDTPEPLKAISHHLKNKIGFFSLVLKRELNQSK